MNRPSLLIAEDEDIQRETLKRHLLEVWPQAQIVAESSNGTDAWDDFLAHEPDVVFLDIRMPGLSGLEVARRIRNRAQIVFITAYGEHALEAFETGALDYLVKPIEPARLAATVARVQQRLDESDRPLVSEVLARLESLERQIKAPRRARLDLLQASIGKEIRFVPLDEVIYFEADARYTRVVHRTPEGSGEVLVRTPLKEIVAGVDEEQFWQIHRSTIVAVREIAKVEREDDRFQVVLRSRPERLAVSRHFQYLFRAS